MGRKGRKGKTQTEKSSAESQGTSGQRQPDSLTTGAQNISSANQIQQPTASVAGAGDVDQSQQPSLAPQGASTVQQSRQPPSVPQGAWGAKKAQQSSLAPQGAWATKQPQQTSSAPQGAWAAKQSQQASPALQGAWAVKQHEQVSPASPGALGAQQPQELLLVSQGAWGGQQPEQSSIEPQKTWEGQELQQLSLASQGTGQQSQQCMPPPQTNWEGQQPQQSLPAPQESWGNKQPQHPILVQQGAWGRGQQPRQSAPAARGAWGGQQPQQTVPISQGPSVGQQPQQSASAARGAWGGQQPQQTVPISQGPPGAQQPRQSAPVARGAWGGQKPQQTVPVSQGPPGGPQPQQSASATRGAWGGQQFVPTAEKTSKGQQSQKSVSASQGACGNQQLQQLPSDCETKVVEGQKESSATKSNEPDSTKSNRPPPQNEVKTRPVQCMSKRGKSGTPIRLQANYFKILSQTDWCLYQYRVDIAPDEWRTHVRKALVRNHKDLFGAYLFDGTMLFTNRRLPKKCIELQTKDEEKGAVVITVRLVGDLDQGDHHYLQLFNILVRKCLENLNLQLVGRNFFDAAARTEVREYRLELWPGYLTSIRQHENSILMCSEITHKVMREQTMLDIMESIAGKHSNGDIHNERYRTDIGNAIIGNIVLTGYNNRTYRVDDVDFISNPNTKFKRNGEEITLMQYYKERYQITIKNPTQPLLVSRAKARERRAGQDELLYLIPELCRSTGLTDQMRSDFRLMKALAVHTKLSPDKRIARLLEFNNRLASKPNVVEDFDRWNFKLDRNLIELDGRVLPNQNIHFSKNDFVTAMNVDWNFKMQEKPFFRAVHLKDWTVVVPSRAKAQAEEFIKRMIEAAQRMSFVIARPQYVTVSDDRADTYVHALEKVASVSNVQIIMCIVSNNQVQRYSAIKKKLCVDRPIPSQVILCKTLTQKSLNMTRAVGSKIAMQMNCKLGGIPWVVSNCPPGIMAVGFDVCHDKSRHGVDFGAMVASLDECQSRYFSAVSRHASGEELSNDLAFHLGRACEVFKKERTRLPNAIVIYRDGVGEGQIPFVYDYEVKQIKKKLQEVYGAEKFRLAFIIVTKRINTRIFSNGKNPPPGTVVDDVITDPLKYDFFLVSQQVREGTVSPTAYNVIEDTTGFTPDQIQLMTYKYCHMYFNFTGGIRVPAPCQYAHKLAFFISQAIGQQPNPRLERQLYFI